MWKKQWTILYNTKIDVPLKTENYSICNLERLAIAEADRNETLNKGIYYCMPSPQI